jgi:hypothetical protein
MNYICGFFCSDPRVKKSAPEEQALGDFPYFTQIFWTIVRLSSVCNCKK